MSDYPYSTGDLMGSPHTYFYTEFCGPDFLRDWHADRTEALRHLPPPADEPPPVDPHAEGTQLMLEEAFEAAGNAKAGNHPLPSDSEMILRKFEVGKRIYDTYDENKKPADRTRYRTIPYYIRAGEIFVRALDASGDIRALNVLLKCVDTLIAHLSDVPESLQPRVARLICSEVEAVLAWADEMDVSWN